MNPDTGLKFSDVFRCTWRGGLAAMIGPLGFILFMAARRSNDVLAIAYLPIILPIAATVGAFIGLIIGLLHLVLGLKVGHLIGFFIGTALSTGLSLVLVYLDRANDPQEFSLLNLFGRAVFLGLLVGVLPGLFSMSKKVVKKGNRARGR